MFLGAIQPWVDRQKSARHSSSGFLALSWNPVLDAISDYVDGKYKALASSADSETKRAAAMASGGAFSAYNNKKQIFGAGDARMVGEGTQKCQLTVFNQLGMSSVYPNLDKKRNDAVHRILGPILQDSINKNFNEQCQRAWDKYGIDLKQELSGLGFK